MSEVTIQVRFTTAEYRALELIARKHDVQVHKLIQTLTRRALNPAARTAPQPRKRVAAPGAWEPDEIALQVREFYLAGMTNDTWIAKAIGVSRAVVANRRERLNLPAAKRGRPSQLSKERAAA